MPDTRTGEILIGQGWVWSCLRCGMTGGAFITREYSEEDAVKHHNECDPI